MASVLRRRAGSRHRSTSTDTRSERAWLIVGLAAFMALAGFVTYVVTRGPSPTPVTTGTFPDPPPPSLATGTAPPAFDLPSIVAGDPAVSLAAAHGKPMVLNFFASWCPNCKAELSSFATVADREAGRVVVVGVDTNDQAAAATRLLRAAGATYPVGVDATATVAAEYRVTALPTTYFVGADGRIAGVAFGAQDVSALMRWVAVLTAEGTH